METNYIPQKYHQLRQHYREVMLVKGIQNTELYKHIKAEKLNENFFYKMGHLLLCCFLLPFVTYWYFKQEYLLATTELAVLIFFCANLRQIVLKKSELLPRPVVLIGLGCQLLALNYYAGSSASLWAYPLLAIYFFILPIRHANYAAAALVAPLSAILFFNAEQVFVIRFVSSIAAMMLIANMIVLINNKLQQELINLSIKDPLTQCYNRRHMAQIFKQMTHLFQRSNTTVSILLIDVDYFKQVNDQFGHLVGDKILCQVVSVIEDNCRASDMLFRYGGEEFVLLLPEENIQNAGLIAEKNRTLLNTITLPDQRFISVSIGVCEMAADMSANDWIKYADQALYQAKSDGRNRVQCYENKVKYSLNSPEKIQNFR